MTACGYSRTALASSAPSLTRTTTARPDSDPKSMPITYRSRPTPHLAMPVAPR